MNYVLRTCSFEMIDEARSQTRREEYGLEQIVTNLPNTGQPKDVHS